MIFALRSTINCIDKCHLVAAIGGVENSLVFGTQVSGSQRSQRIRIRWDTVLVWQKSVKNQNTSQKGKICK